MSEGSVPPPPSTATPPSAPVHALSKLRLGALFALPVVLIGVAYGTGGMIYKKFGATTTDATPVRELDGAKLFAKHCASCHGPNGDGKGVAHLEPPARHFGMEKFKLASTVNGIPSDADLMRVILNGIPGSSMPGFGIPHGGQAPILNDEQCLAVISHIRQLTRNGLYAQLYAKAVKDYDDGGDDPNPLLIAKKVDELTKPGEPLVVPSEFPSPSEAALAHGKELYVKTCAGCHGPLGKGDGPQVLTMKNENGTPNRPRDLTAGIFKGGGDPAKLYTRIRLGIPGTPMPATPLANMPDKDVNDLIQYVLSLSSGKTTPGTTVAAK